MPHQNNTTGLLHQENTTGMPQQETQQECLNRKHNRNASPENTTGMPRQKTQQECPVRKHNRNASPEQHNRNASPGKHNRNASTGMFHQKNTTGMPHQKCLTRKPISTSLNWWTPSVEGFVQSVHNTALSVPYKTRAGWPFIKLFLSQKRIKILTQQRDTIQYSLCDFRLPSLRNYDLRSSRLLRSK